MNILFYGAPWCPDCVRAKKFLDDHKIKYKFIDVDEDEGASQKVMKINCGNRSIPTIIFPDGKILVEPNNDELEQAIVSANRLPHPASRDSQ